MQQEQQTPNVGIPFVGHLSRLVPLLLLLALVTAVSLSSGLVFDFDYDIGHFDFGSASFYIMTVAIVASTVCSTVLGLRSAGRFTLTALPTSEPLSTFSAYFTALMAVITSAAYLYDRLVMHLPSNGTLELLSAVLFPTVSVSMILGAHEKTAHSTAHVFFSLLAPIAVTLNMFACYFDFSLPLNSPVRDLVIVAQSGVLLFLLSETRLAISPDKRATAPFFIFTSAFATSAVLGISLGLCVFGFVSPHAVEMDISVYRFATYFGVALLALSRLRPLDRFAGDYVAPPEPEEDKNKKDKKQSDSQAEDATK